MSEDKFQLFRQKYPKLFKEYPRCGFYLGTGWEPLAHELCGVLDWHILHLPEEEGAGIYCVQVKEKFGSLRFYMSSETPFISGAIAMAESMSVHICEICGLPGEIRSGGWLKALCDKHWQETKEK